MCCIVLWSRSVLHHIEYTREVTGALTQTRHGMVQGGIAVAGDILWCTETGLRLIISKSETKRGASIGIFFSTLADS